jgi:phage-related protein (TIGR01555 family)
MPFTLYVISRSRGHKLSKLGRTAKPLDERLRALQTGNGNRLKIFAAYELPDDATASRIEWALLTDLTGSAGVGEWVKKSPLELVEIIEAKLQAEHLEIKRTHHGPQWGGARNHLGTEPTVPLEETVAAEPKKAEPRRPMFSDDMVTAILRHWEEQKASNTRARSEDWNPFKIRPEKFGPVADYLKKNHPKLAMDQDPGIGQANQFAMMAWQAGGLLGNAESEGLLFMGYPYLSMLAQRPEYRLFGEIRAQEMTRKFTEFRGVQDESTKEGDDDDQDEDRDDNDDDDNPIPGGAQDREPFNGTPVSRETETTGPRQGKGNPDDRMRAQQKEQNGDKPRSDKRNREIEDKIKELNDAIEGFRIRDWFQAAAAQDSFFGISHMMIDLEGSDPENLNDPELRTPIGNGRDEVTQQKLSKGCLKGFRTIEPIWVYPTTYNAVNPLLKSWYEPQVWYVMGTEIHRSRLLTFVGRPVPDILKPAYAFGGLSMTQMAQPYVTIWLRTRESVGQIIHAFSVMVLATNLGTTTMPGGAGGGNGDVLARVALFNMLRDNQGAFVIDKATEDFKNVSAPVTGLEGLQAQAQEHMFSVGRIPAVKFAGIQPTGLNASSEGEIRAFYDTVIGEQEHLFRPNLTTVYDLIQIHLWGKRDEDITYDFVPLWELTEKEKAEKRKLDAECDQIRIDSGVVSPEEVRGKVAADPESGFHHLDPSDVPDLLSEMEQGLVVPGGGKAEEAVLGQAGGGGPPGLQKPKPPGAEKKNGAEDRLGRPFAADAARKLKKNKAKYTDGPVEHEPCDECTMWREPDRCTAVRGTIEPKGHCKLFEPVTAKDQVPPVSVDPQQLEMNVRGFTEQEKGFRAHDDAPTPKESQERAVITAGGTIAGDAGFEEHKHKRDEEGKFSTMGGGGAGAKEKSGRERMTDMHKEALAEREKTGERHGTARVELPDGGVAYYSIEPARGNTRGAKRGPHDRPSFRIQEPGEQYSKAVSAAVFEQRLDRGGTSVPNYKRGAQEIGSVASSLKRKEWQAHTPQTYDALVAAAPANQKKLINVMQKVGSQLNMAIKDPGPKSPERLQEKIERGKPANNIGDAARAGMSPKTPEEADLFVNALAQEFEIVDEGWNKKIDTGYFDRVVMVRFPDGMMGEVQFWPPGMLETKEEGEGHELYEAWQKLENDKTPAGKAERERLTNVMAGRFAEVEKGLGKEWKSLFREEQSPQGAPGQGTPL